RCSRFGGCHEWHSVKPNTLGLKVLRTKTPARRPMINNMSSISLDGKPCVSEAYSVLFIYNAINLILVRVERKSLIRKTLILIRVPFMAVTFSPPTGRLADPSTEELGLAGQPSRRQEGAGSGSPQRAARTALRQRAMVRTDRPDSGSRIHRTPTGPAPQDGSLAWK